MYRLVGLLTEARLVGLLAAARGVCMQVQSSVLGGASPVDGIASTFSDWAQAHRSSGGDFDERALQEGIRATTAAYSGGHSMSDAFEIGRHAYYATLG